MKKARKQRQSRYTHEKDKERWKQKQSRKKQKKNESKKREWKEPIDGGDAPAKKENSELLVFPFFFFFCSFISVV